MGSSDTGGGMVDCSVGSIVWVRRRNGSWWPGKILGPEELSASYASSPRSGTPVKLLGREDASVDWYNLEKSKRVKAFRCGEFDDCIGRAEAAYGMPPKKREKYARREDAVMHALELERQLMEKNYGNSEKSSWTMGKLSPDVVSSSGYIGNEGGNKNSHVSDPPCERLALSLPEKNEANLQLYETKLTDGNQVSGDDSAGMLPRMRGLKDFGLRIAPSMGDDQVSRVVPRAKRSKYSHVQFYPVDCANNNLTLPSQMEIQVSKVDESFCPSVPSEDRMSRSAEDTETDCSKTDSLESDSDEDLAASEFLDGSASIELRPKYPRRTEVHEDHGSFSSSDDIDGVPLGSEVTKWPLKGKRRNRILGKKALDSLDSETSSGYTNGNSNRVDSIDKRTHLITDFESRFWSKESAKMGYLKDLQEYVNHGKHSPSNRLMLVDVDLQVNGNSYRRNVPMISLTSKLNGHAIVGHPIHVEPLESGASANFLPPNCSPSEPLESPVLTSVWRTGHRTANVRVRRPFSSSRLSGDSKVNAQSFSHDARDHGSVPQRSLLRGTASVGPASNLKIRSLSSIAAEHQHQNSGSVGYEDERLIRAGNGTVVACIPVNLVFSRLHEELVARHQ